MQPAPKPQTDSPICVSEKRVSQWEDIMRKFSRQHEEECRQTVLKMPLARRSTKYFPTGSQYNGTWDVLGMSGCGVYTFPNGVIYEGDFEDGMFHGIGQLRYPNGTVVRGHFKMGVMTKRKLIFADGLKYEEEDWEYCKMPDRRYTVEYDKGLQPAGMSNITAKMPPRDIPPGFYDTGDGMYNPETKSVYNADDLTIMLRSPSVHEQRWILDNCRTAPETVLGPRPDLYEEWSVPHLAFPPSPQPAASTIMMRSRKHETGLDCGSNMDSASETWSSRKSNKWSSQDNHGYEASSEASIHHNNTLEANRSSPIHKVRLYNLKFKNEDDSANFPAIPKNYSDLFSKNIDVALATLFQNPNDAVFKYKDDKNSSTLKRNTDMTKSVKKISTPILDENRDTKIKMSTLIKLDDVLCDDFSDMLPECSREPNAKTLTRSESYNQRNSKNLGLTSSVMMFKNAQDVISIAEDDNIISRRSSDTSEVQINTWQAKQTLFDSIYDNATQ